MRRDGKQHYLRFGYRLLTLVGLASVVALTSCARLNKLLGKATVAQKMTLRIGLVGSGYGPTSLADNFAENGASLAVDAINTAGGVTWQGKRYTLALALSNGPDVATNITHAALASPQIVALIGPDASAPTLAALPVVASTHLPAFTLATDPALTDPHLNHQANDIFRMRPAATQFARAVAGYATQRGAGKIALAFLDAPYGQMGADLLTASLGDASASPVARVVLPPGIVDASAQAQQIRAAGANTVLCWSTASEAVALLHALRAAGWRGQFVSGILDADFIALAGPAGDGVVGAVSWAPTPTTPASQQFDAAFRQRFSAAPDEHAAAAYDAVTLIAQGVAAVGPDPQALDAYFSDVKMSGAAGYYDPLAADSLTGAVGDLTARVTLARVQQGQMILLAPAP